MTPRRRDARRFTSRRGTVMRRALLLLVGGILPLISGCLLFPRRNPPVGRGATWTWRISREVAVVELRPGVWLHTSWQVQPDGTHVPSNGLIVREGNGLLLIDTAWGEGATEHLLRWTDTRLRLPVRRAIVTHSHHDRMGGAEALRRRGIPILAHPLTRRLAGAQGLPVPDTIAGLGDAGSVARVGAAEVFYPGPGHAPDNLMVWLPEQAVLFGGCAVRSASARSPGNLAHADTAAWPAALARAAARYPGAEVVVPGHGAPGGPELLAHTRALLRGVQRSRVLSPES